MTTLPPEELRALLENAAKACGIDAEELYPISQPDVLFAHGQEWQPHIPGLDSQLLAAELNIDTLWRMGAVNARSWHVDNGLELSERYSNHPSKAHAQAMAVLRVAAAIGEAM